MIALGPALAAAFLFLVVGAGFGWAVRPVPAPAPAYDAAPLMARLDRIEREARLAHVLARWEAVTRTGLDRDAVDRKAGEEIGK